MVMKKCIVCGKEFDAQNNQKSCSKECSKERTRQRNKKYRQDNKEYFQQYYQDNKEHFLQKSRQYRQDNKEYFQQYYQNNKKHYQQYSKQYRQNNKEHIQQRGRQYYQDNKEHILQKSRQYYQDNKEYYQRYDVQRKKREVNELIKQYDGDLEKILENVPSRWHLREAKMQVWFNESYYDGMMVKVKSTPCCEITGEKDNLVIHHLWSFSTHPELGADPANMVRITEDVHKAFHKKYGYGDNTPQQWEEFVSNYIKR